MGGTLKVQIDFDRCASNGICAELLPDVFEVREDGYLYLLNETPDDSLAELLDDAVESCPTQALSLIPEETGT